MKDSGLTYDEVRGEDLEDLCAETGAASEDSLEDANEQVAHWGADESAVCGHLRHARADVMAMFAAVVGKP